MNTVTASRPPVHASTAVATPTPGVSVFAWSGRDAQQQVRSGLLESRSASQVAQALAGMGIVPTKIELAPPPVEDAGATFSRWMQREAVDSLTLQLFTRQLHTLLRAGVPVMRALQALQESATHPGLGSSLQALRNALEGGLPLWQAMAKQPKVFDSFFVAMVRVGEATGQMSEVLGRLHDHIEFDRHMREQVASALRYPKFVMLAMAVALAVINLWVIPAFAKVFTSAKVPLPLMTQILLGSSRFFIHAWPALLGGALAAWWGLRKALAEPSIRLAWDRYKLRLPLVGSLLNQAALARACCGLATVLRSGVPMLEALNLAAGVVHNGHLERALLSLRASVERGESVLLSARKTGIFTPVVLQMIQVGEESGKLDELLDEVGQLYQREVQQQLKTLAQRIEPLLLLVLGAMVLVLALGVFMPMWDLSRAVLR